MYLIRASVGAEALCLLIRRRIKNKQLKRREREVPGQLQLVVESNCKSHVAGCAIAVAELNCKSRTDASKTNLTAPVYNC